MTKRQKEDLPPFVVNQWDCYTKDDHSIRVTYQAHTSFKDQIKYDTFVKSVTTPSENHLFLLHKQIAGAITYVLKHYQHSMINDHKDHIERQIKNCLNENYQEEMDLLSTKGLVIKSFEFIKVIRNIR